MEVKGPSQLPGLTRGGRLQVRLVPATQTQPAHWALSGQVTPWEFWGAVSKRGPGFWEASSVAGQSPPAGGLEPWTAVTHDLGVTQLCPISCAAIRARLGFSGRRAYVPEKPARPCGIVQPSLKSPSPRYFISNWPQAHKESSAKAAEGQAPAHLLVRSSWQENAPNWAGGGSGAWVGHGFGPASVTSQGLPGEATRMPPASLSLKTPACAQGPSSHAFHREDRATL